MAIIRCNASANEVWQGIQDACQQSGFTFDRTSRIAASIHSTRRGIQPRHQIQLLPNAGDASITDILLKTTPSRSYNRMVYYGPTAALVLLALSPRAPLHFEYTAHLLVLLISTLACYATRVILISRFKRRAHEDLYDFNVALSHELISRPITDLTTTWRSSWEGIHLIVVLLLGHLAYSTFGSYVLVFLSPFLILAALGVTVGLLLAGRHESELQDLSERWIHSCASTYASGLLVLVSILGTHLVLGKYIHPGPITVAGLARERDMAEQMFSGKGEFAPLWFHDRGRTDMQVIPVPFVEAVCWFGSRLIIVSALLHLGFVGYRFLARGRKKKIALRNAELMYGTVGLLPSLAIGKKIFLITYSVLLGACHWLFVIVAIDIAFFLSGGSCRLLHWLSTPFETYWTIMRIGLGPAWGSAYAAGILILYMFPGLIMLLILAIRLLRLRFGRAILRLETLRLSLPEPVAACCTRYGWPEPEIYVLDRAKPLIWSRQASIHASGGEVFVSAEVIARFDRDELCSLLLHELCHIHADGTTVALLKLASVALLFPTQYYLMLYGHTDCEMRADRFAVKVQGTSEYLERALAKLAVFNSVKIQRRGVRDGILAEWKQPVRLGRSILARARVLAGEQFLGASYPLWIERVRNLRQTVAEDC